MVMFVTLQQASDHLRRDQTDDDAYLTQTIEDASEAILNYLGTVDFLDSAGEVELDSNGQPIGVPGAIRRATFITITMFYEDRKGEDSGELASKDRLGKMSLPAQAHFLLDPLRSPRLA